MCHHNGDASSVGRRRNQEFQVEQRTQTGMSPFPYLFTLCVERLGHCILEEVSENRWCPMRLSPGGPPLSHLFFVNDLVLFVEASLKQAEVINTCVDRFCNASGELVSKDKYRILFSKNTRDRDGKNICEKLGIQSTLDLGRYLGVPVIHGRIIRKTYRYIIDKIDQKITSWKARTLSLAGRVTLALSVLNAIPTYVMQTMMLNAIIDKIDQKITSWKARTLSLAGRVTLALSVLNAIPTCDLIDKKIRWFVWGSNEEKKNSIWSLGRRFADLKTKGG
ncbi:unnamed protein product [Linum trigynum]|uniref:Reverse transcriptase n=1 Tax=Linum trigynum TaxID=586398 RepID=A0AAV2D9Y6_9ROSI